MRRRHRNTLSSLPSQRGGGGALPVWEPSRYAAVENLNDGEPRGWAFEKLSLRPLDSSGIAGRYIRFRVAKTIAPVEERSEMGKTWRESLNFPMRFNAGRSRAVQTLVIAAEVIPPQSDADPPPPTPPQRLCSKESQQECALTSCVASNAGKFIIKNLCTVNVLKMLMERAGVRLNNRRQERQQKRLRTAATNTGLPASRWDWSPPHLPPNVVTGTPTEETIGAAIRVKRWSETATDVCKTPRALKAMDVALGLPVSPVFAPEQISACSTAFSASQRATGTGRTIV